MSNKQPIKLSKQAQSTRDEVEYLLYIDEHDSPRIKKIKKQILDKVAQAERLVKEANQLLKIVNPSLK